MIFQDVTSLRWKWFRVGSFALGGVILLLAADWLLTILVGPTLPHTIRIEHSLAELLSAGVEPSPPTTDPAPQLSTTRTAESASPRLLRAAFVVQDDPASISDLTSHLLQLDLVFPDWYRLSDENGAIVEKVDPRLAEMLKTANAKVFPRLSNTDASGNWRGDAFSILIHDYADSDRFFDQLVASLQARGLPGVNLDLEDIHTADREAYLDWLERLTVKLRQHNLQVCVDVPLNDEAFDYEMIGRIADSVVVMAYDEHYAGGKPGPIASAAWFADGIEQLSQRIPPRKMIVALGAYGYDWNLSAHRPADSLGFAELMDLAEDSGADIETDASAHNSFFHYLDDKRNRHEVWFLDAVSAWNQMLILRQVNVGGVALWRLGMEEPDLWTFAALDDLDSFDPRGLARIEPGRGVAVVGEGELLKVTRVAEYGRRALTFDGKFIDYASYEKIPTCCTVEKTGHAGGKAVALTFDDGPDPEWTPQILKVLREHNVCATFFVVGDQVQRHPDLLRQEVAEGHFIGNHTFFHPNLLDCSQERVRIELNSTQRIIESVTGRHALLFRAPYDTDSSPTSERQIAPLDAACKLGYVVAAADIDSRDYLRLGKHQIVRNVLEGLETSGGNVVVFHDGGGNRQQTVAAVADLIPELQARGYQIVGLNELLHLDAAKMMPEISSGEHAMVLGSLVMTWLRSTGWNVLEWLFFLTTGLSILRILFLSLFVFRRRRNSNPVSGFNPDVLVLIPAYNEEKVIRRTLASVLASDYPNLSVLVVNDGSTDNTAGAVREVAATDSRVRLLTVKNGGKAAALNRGFQTAAEPIIVTIDADTIIARGTIRSLVAPLADNSIDAVCGNVQVGNVHNLLTAFQDVEYVTSQNYDRRAFDALNCISVVPGATGAWRRRSVLRAGGYSSETLTEDADLTLCLLRNGARIVYAPEARSITEAPESLGALARQRFRWSFGTLQCLWKHHQAFFRGALGWVALPNWFLFQLLFPLLSPLGDLIFLLALVRGDSRAILAGYLMFLSMDVVGGLIAFALDRRSLKNLWVVLVQRFFYRQFMYVVTIRALLAAIKGRRYGWNKLERRGSVVARPAAPGAAVPAMQFQTRIHQAARTITA